mgnify:CR=1 FL=1
MARNGSGTYNRPVSSYEYNTVISETSVNTEMTQIASALTASIAKDGQTVPTANLPMGGSYRHTGVSNGAARTDYAALGQLQDSAPLFLGTNTVTASATPAIAAYAAGQTFRFKAGGTNTGAVTLNLNSLGAKAVQKRGAALVAGDITANNVVTVVYDGTQFQMTSPAAAAVIPSASTTVAGIVELATTAETTTGTDALRAVTPDGLHDMTSLAGAAWFLDEDTLSSDSNVKVPSQQSVKAYVDASGFTLPSPQATTSGTSIDFTSIPAGTKVITINFNGVSTNGSSDTIIQIGDSGGVETSGYTGANVDSTQSGGVDMSAGFILDNLQAAGTAHYGSVVLTLLNSSTFIWAMTSTIAHGSYLTFSAGGKTLSAELDRVRLTTENGSDTFDAGSVNILYGS